MRLALMSTMILTLIGCNRGKIALDEVEDADDVEDACDDYERDIEDRSVEVVFPAATEACAWGEDDNLTATDGQFTARNEETQALDIDDEVILCDIDMDLTGLVPGEVQVMVYDDHFFFTFNDVVLAASFGPAVSDLESSGKLRYYDWDDVVGTNYHVDSFDSYCLGESTGDSECEIPPTEIEGPISLNFGSDIVNNLSADALDAGRFDFGFVTTGDDNADSDCMHAEFGFTVDLEYLEL